jgi:hypothetical protein
MSNCPCYAARIKNEKAALFPPSNFGLFHGKGRLAIAPVGTALLVSGHNGRPKLIGGTADNNATAREWRSLFAPKVVFTFALRPATSLSVAA